MSLILFCFAILVYSKQNYTVKRFETGANLIYAMVPELWILPDLDSEVRELAQLHYINGFLDAVAYWEARPQKLRRWSSECKGMDIQQLVDTVNKFYEDYPQWRDRPPAFVVAIVIPRLRKGLPPMPPDTTQIDIEGLKRDYGIPDSLKKK